MWSSTMWMTNSGDFFGQSSSSEPESGSNADMTAHENLAFKLSLREEINKQHLFVFILALDRVGSFL
jgi:hypothetical protein